MLYFKTHKICNDQVSHDQYFIATGNGSLLSLTTDLVANDNIFVVRY